MTTIEGTYTKTPNIIVEAMMIAKFNAAEIKVILAVIRYTYGFHREEHYFSVSFIARATGYTKRHVSKILQGLIKNRVLIETKKYTTTCSRWLKVNEDISQWKGYGTNVKQMNISSPDEVQFTSTEEPEFHSTDEPHFAQETKKIKEKTKQSTNNDSKAEEAEKYFDIVWNAYPNRMGKSRVLPKQRRLLWKEVPLEEMLRAIERYKKTIIGKDEKFVLYGSSFFNNDYQDYLDDTYVTPSKTINLQDYNPNMRW